MRERKVYLDRAILTDMLGDPDFYVECPVFLFMRDMGIESYNLYMQELQNPACNNCADRAIMKTALVTFLRHLKELHSADPENLAPIKSYVEKRKGYRPNPCVIYYKESQKPAVPIEF
jgi:hypothetical protein